LSRNRRQDREKDWLDGPLPRVAEIHARLQKLVPETEDPRGWVRRELAAKILFVMLYGYAIEGRNRWIRPTAVTDMTDNRAGLQDPAERIAWLDLVQSPNRPRNIPGRWYGENSREQIRDESLRAMLELGLVVERPGLPTTSPKPRYALAESLVELLSPTLEGDQLENAIDAWREAHLSKAALMRISIVRKGAASDQEGVLVRLPNGEVRRMAPGPSSKLTKAVAEEMATRFLGQPAVALLSESALKVSYRDDELCKAIGFDFEASEILPDLLLADLGSDPPLLVFVECVVSDGPVNERRRKELGRLALKADYQEASCGFVTAFHDRVKSPYRSMSSSLAWGSFVWFETEPDHLIYLRQGYEERATTLADLLEA